MQKVLVLGCGFTGVRVAKGLLARGAAVTATTRDESRLAELRESGAEVVEFSVNVLSPAWLPSTIVRKWDAVVYSLPTLRLHAGMLEATPFLARTLSACSNRCVYLSTTGVYGRQTEIDSSSQPQPETERETLRVEAERAVCDQFSQPLVLRPAAIYGPHRGVHASLRAGHYQLTGEGNNYISRIHVEDLAAHVLAALESGLTGCWPVADERPTTQREMAAFCASLLNISPPISALPASNAETLRANRKVDGRAVRQALGIALRYPSFREGVPAAMEAEAGGPGAGRA